MYEGIIMVKSSRSEQNWANISRLKIACQNHIFSQLSLLKIVFACIVIVHFLRFDWLLKLRIVLRYSFPNKNKMADRNYNVFVSLIYKQISKYSAVNKKDVNAHWLDMFFKNVLYSMKF